MEYNKVLQLLRNNIAYPSRAAALAAFQTKLASAADGELILCRYSEGSVSKTLLGVGGDYKTIFDVDAIPSLVQTALDELTEKIDNEVNRATTSENALNAAINKLNGDASTEGSVAKAVADEAQFREAADKVLGSRVDVLEAAIGEGGSVESQIESAIGELDATVSGNGTHVTVEVVEADGILTGVTVTESDIASAQSLADEIAARKAVDGQNGQTYSANAGANYIADAASLNDADVKLDAAVKANADTISAMDAAYKAADTALENKLLGKVSDTDAKTIAALNDKIESVEDAAKTYSIKAITEGLETNVKEAFKLVDEDGTQAGETIKIYKDSSLKSVALNDQTLNFTYILTDGTESTVGVDVSSFLAESEFKNGLQVVDHLVSVKIDETSEAFLTVGEGGVKLSGVQNAINTAKSEANTYADGLNTAMDSRVDVLEAAIGELDVDAIGGAGKMITTVSEADGKVSAIAIDATAANIAVADAGKKFTGTDVEAVLAEIDTAYKAADTALKNELVGTATEDYNTLGKLETKIKAAEKAASDAVAALDVTDTANEYQYVSAVSETDGKITVTRANLIAASAEGNANDMLSTDANGSILLSNVFDMGTY